MSDMDVGNGGNTMGMFLMGAIVGAGLALLLAPATGDDTRKKVGEAARKLGSRASDLVGRASEEAESFQSGGAGEPYRSGGRREPMNARSASPGTPGTTS